jgi:hypothetical protein
MSKRPFLIVAIAVLFTSAAAWADSRAPLHGTVELTFQPAPPTTGTYAIACDAFPGGGSSGVTQDWPLAGPNYYHPAHGVPSILERIFQDVGGDSFSMNVEGIVSSVTWTDEGALVTMDGHWQLVGGDGAYAKLRGDGDWIVVITFEWRDGGIFPVHGSVEMDGAVGGAQR